MKKEKKKKDGEVQVEVKGEVDENQGETLIMDGMEMTVTDSMNLSQKDHDTLSTRRTTTNGVLLCSLVQFARIVLVHVILIDGVLGVIVDVLIGHDEVLVIGVIHVAIFVVIFCIWRCTLYKHRVGTNKIRTYPPIATVYINFFFCGNVGVVLVR